MNKNQTKENNVELEQSFLKSDNIGYIFIFICNVGLSVLFSIIE
jgi:hypothetical protein